MVVEELRAGMDDSGGGVATSRSKAAHSTSSTVDAGGGVGAVGVGMGCEGRIVVGAFNVLNVSAGVSASSTLPAGGFVVWLLASMISSKKPPGTSTADFVLFLESSSSLLAFRFLLPLLVSRVVAGSKGLEVLNRNLSARIACCVDLRCLFQTSVSDLSGIWQTLHSKVPVAE